MDNWQDISTAPKDGTQFLAFVPSYYQGKGGYALCLWLNGKWMDGAAWEVKPTLWARITPPTQTPGK